MSIVVLNAASSLNCFANKAEQMRKPLARAVIIAPHEYFPLSRLFLRAVKERLPRLGEVRPVARALPQAVPAAACSPFSNK
jgi:hypothetical protein